MSYKIEFLKEKFNLKELTETFSLAFSDYVIKFTYSEEELDQKIKGEDISLDLSSAVFEKNNNKLVGFILHAVDNFEKPIKLYNSVTGIVPSARGQKLVEEQYKMMVPIFKEKGIKSVVLEVINTNERAIKVYERCQFATIRLFNSYKGNLNKEILIKHLNKNIRIKELEKWNQSIVNFINNYSECEPSWSNTIQCIEREFIENFNKCWIAYENDGDEIIGFISIHISSKRIRQVLVHPNFRNQNIGTTLIYQMINDLNDQSEEICTYNIANLDQGYEPLINFFNKRLNLPYWLSQNEMELKI